MNLWRTQVHFVEGNSQDPDELTIELPGWDVEAYISINRKDLPSEIAKVAAPGYRCHVHASLAARTAKELKLNYWELT